MNEETLRAYEQLSLRVANLERPSLSAIALQFVYGVSLGAGFALASAFITWVLA